MEFTVIGHALNGPNLATVRLYGEDSTGFHGPAIQKDGAGAAFCGVAANMGPSEHQDVSDEMNQEQSRFYLSLVVLAVHFHANVFFGGHNYLAI